MDNYVDNSEATAFKAETAAAWLDGIRRLKREAELAYDLAATERDMIDGLRGIDYSKEPGASSADPMLGAVARLQASVARYEATLEEYLEERDRAATAIMRVEMPGRAVLAYHYLADRPYQWIEGRLAYSHGGVMKLRRQALAELYGVMPADARPDIPKAI